MQAEERVFDPYDQCRMRPLREPVNAATV